jgi:hypothetical protein
MGQWAMEAGIAPDVLLSDVRQAFNAKEYDHGQVLIEATAKNDLAALADIIDRYRPPDAVLTIDLGLDLLPATPIGREAAAKMREIAEAICAQWSDWMADLKIDPAYGAADLVAAKESFRTAIVRAFGDGLPGVSGPVSDAQLAVLSLWLSPHNGCDGERLEKNAAWYAIHGAERRAIALARKRLK